MYIYTNDNTYILYINICIIYCSLLGRHGWGRRLPSRRRPLYDFGFRTLPSSSNPIFGAFVEPVCGSGWLLSRGGPAGAVRTLGRPSQPGGGPPRQPSGAQSLRRGGEERLDMARSILGDRECSAGAGFASFLERGNESDCWDLRTSNPPSELCVVRANSGETLMAARSVPLTAIVTAAILTRGDVFL